MSDPNAPWASLNLTDEQDEMVQGYVQLQMMLAGKIRKFLAHLALAVFFVWAGRSYMHYMTSIAGPSDLPGIELLSDVLFKWAFTAVAVVWVGMIAWAMHGMKQLQTTLPKLPLSPHQVEKVREITTWAIELALFGRVGFKLLRQVRAKLRLFS